MRALPVSPAAAIPDLGLLARGRRRLGELIRRYRVEVPIELLLMGGQNGISAVRYSLLTGEPSWRSTKLVDGPHVDLFRRFAAGEEIPRDGERLHDVPYVRLATLCIVHTGFYFDYTDVGQLDSIIDETRQRWSAESAVLVRLDAERPLVRAVRNTPFFEVINGHHRLARAWVEGRATAFVDVTWSSAPSWEEPR